MLLDKELLNKNIHKIAKYDFENEKVFGSAYCVIQQDRVVYKNCFGYLSDETNAPVTEHTLFRLASMTKPITAMAVLILMDRGQLKLSDPVSNYLPAFGEVRIVKCPNPLTCIDLGKPKKDVTIEHLLTHTSGFGSEETKVVGMTVKDKSTIDNSIQYFLREGLDFEPGTKQQYSGTGAFDVLVKIIEQITLLDYQDFLQKEIFEPCGMYDTTFVPHIEQWQRMIAMHKKVNGKSAVRKMKNHCIFGDYPCTHYLGGAGLVSTLADYGNFAKMLLNKGKTQTTALVSEETFQLLCTPKVSKEIMPGPERWGLGVRVIVDASYQTLPVGSFGWSGAYGSHFWIDPENEIAAVFMKNSIFDGGAGNESARNFEKAVNNSFVKISEGMRHSDNQN